MRPIVTSFSPNPKDAERQVECFESWRSQGFQVKAVQGSGERIPERIDDRLAFTGDVTELDEPGPPRLSHLLREADAWGGAIILNSDVFMLPGFFDAMTATESTTHGSTGCLWFRRWNVPEDAPIELTTREKYGIDAFSLWPSAELRMFFEPLDLRIGRPGWDYVLPYWLLMRGLPLWTIDDPPLLLHREHPIKWSQASWERNTLLGAKALGLAPTVQLQRLALQLNSEIDKYSKRLDVSAQFDSSA